MKRREFIKSTTAFSLVGASGLPLTSFASKQESQLTILHTNDVHSHIDTFPDNHPKYPGQGGIVKRAQLIDEIKKTNRNILLLDAGDAFQGTPYFNYFGGSLEYKLMSKLGYHATTLGNHEFDNGIESLVAQFEHATFDILNANYEIKNTALTSKIKPFEIYSFDSLRIGVIGLGVELEGLVDPRNFKGVIYRDPVAITNEIAKDLKTNYRCDLVICLSHLGYQYTNDPNKISDIKLAASTENVDLIIGGHTHTFLQQPTVVTNKIGDHVIINQVGCFGVNLGKLDYTFQKQHKKVVPEIVMI